MKNSKSLKIPIVENFIQKEFSINEKFKNEKFKIAKRQFNIQHSTFKIYFFASIAWQAVIATM